MRDFDVQETEPDFRITLPWSLIVLLSLIEDCLFMFSALTSVSVDQRLPVDVFRPRKSARELKNLP